MFFLSITHAVRKDMDVNKHEKLSNLALRNNITEILLKVPLNTITLNQTKC
jgi:hypothetical protein